jgi:hypothetical protein
MLKKFLDLSQPEVDQSAYRTKNILPIGGKPLIVWAIMAAQASRYIDQIEGKKNEPE